MRKVIMGVGTVLVVVGLIQLILSVALIGGVRAQVADIDPLIGDAAVALTDVADSVDRGVGFLEDLDPNLAELEGTIGDTIDDTVSHLGDLDANLADAEGDVVSGLDGVVTFLDDLDSVLAAVEDPLGMMDDAVGYLETLYDNLAVVEARLLATIDGTLTYLEQLDTSLADVQDVATGSIDDTLELVRELDAELAGIEETLTEITDEVVFTRDETKARLEELVLEILAQDIEQLVDPAEAVLADVERSVEDIITDVESVQDETKELLEPIEFGAWAVDLIGWAEWLEDFEFDAAVLRDWAEYIDPGWMLFPLEISPGELMTLADLLDRAGMEAEADMVRDEADRLAQEGLMIRLSPEDIAGVFTPLLDNLNLASESLADASAWLGFWPEFLERVERDNLSLRIFPLQLTADDVDAWADHVEAEGLNGEWLRTEADRLRQDDLMWSITPEDFARAFTPVIEGLDYASAGLSTALEYMGTLQANLDEARTITVDNIVRARDFLVNVRGNIDDIRDPLVESIADGMDLLGTARMRLAEANDPIIDGLASSRDALRDTETSVVAARSPVIDAMADIRELLGTARTSIEDVRTPALDGIADTREYLLTAQTDLGALGDDLRAISDDIVGLEVGGMIDGMIGWLQGFMITMSILFMAAGAGLFLVGMKRAES